MQTVASFASDIERDVEQLLLSDGVPVTADAGGGAPRLAIHRVQGDDSAIEIQVVHHFR